MPHDKNLKDFLKQNDLQKYHSDFVDKLGVTAVDHLVYVQSDDVKQLGMSQPEWRRLRASMKKHKKKSGKEKSNKGSNMAKPGHEPARQTSSGGHIIPASSLDILDRELGRGEFGKVMQGIWTNSENQKIQVAIKCLSPEKVSIDKHQQDFLKEAAIMYSLNHEHLVKLFGVVLDVDSSLMLVTEFAPLRSLAENIKQEALKASFPVTLLVEFSVQITDAMRYLHSSNIIHRDLATRNILLFINEVGTKTVKISDFGLSRRLLLGENYRSEMKPHLKLPLAWMPVEALTKLTFTKASDVYSFGVTMWEMFSYGCQPWATRSGEEILKAIDKPNFQRLERPEACPKSVYDMMLKCWSHQPEDRPTFAELHSDLPMTKPLQVRAVSSHVASSPDELTFRTDDIITVIEKSDKSGMWTGVSPLGKVGKFECTKTSAAGGGPGPTSPTREKKGSKAKRAKSGKSKEVKKSSSLGGINKIDIGAPRDYQHIFHVGPDGQVEGDPTFGGTDYSTMPVTSLHVEKSPQTRRILRPTQLPPSVPPLGAPEHTVVVPSPHQPRKASPESFEPPPSLEAAAPQYVNRVEASPDILHGTTDVPDGRARKENNHNSLVYQNGKDSPSSPEEFSSFEMGSLLEECLSAWESVGSQLRMEDEETNGLEGEGLNLLTANRTKNNNSTIKSNPISINQGGKPREVGVGSSINFHDANDTTHPSGGMASLPLSATSTSSHPDTMLNLHNMIIKDRICTQSQTKRFVPSRRGHDPQQPKDPSAGRVLTRRHSEASGVALPVVESPHPASDNTRYERRWRTEFKRLSSTTPKNDSNEYLDDVVVGGETPPSPVRDSAPQSVTGPSTKMCDDVDQPPVKSSTGKRSRRADYEELSLALSPDPGTYNFQFAMNQTSQVTRCSSLKETGQQPPKDNLPKSQSFRSYDADDGLFAYNVLIGGKLSDKVGEKPPAVPPKPRRMNFVDKEEVVLRKTALVNSTTSSSELSPQDGASCEPAKSSKATQRQSVRVLKSMFETAYQEEVPPLPPREPVSTLHQLTSLIKPLQPESSPSRSPHSDLAKTSSQSPVSGDPPGEPNNNNNEEEVYRLSAETLEKLQQERRPRRPRRRSRSAENSSESSDQSPVKTRHSTSEEEEDQVGLRSEKAISPKRSPVRLEPGRSPQRRKGLPDLPENDQTNRPHNLHTTPPIPPRKPPSVKPFHTTHSSVNVELDLPSPPTTLAYGKPPKDTTSNHATSSPRSSPRHLFRQDNGNDSLDFQARVSPVSHSPSRTSTNALLNDTMKSLATLSPRSSPQHRRRESTDLPNCYAQDSDGLDLAPQPPLLPCKRSKSRMPPRLPPRKPQLIKRSKTVDVTSTPLQPLVKRSDTISNDVDMHKKRSELKSAAFDRCIIDPEDNFIRGNPRLIRGILEMQGHSFDTTEEEDEGEPDYPPPPVPLEEPTIMTEKHIPFRQALLPDPLSPEDRENILKTLERQSSVPLSLTFDHCPYGDRRGSDASKASDRSSASYVSPRNSVGAASRKHMRASACENYDTPRKVAENQLLRYNISTTLENRVRFSPCGPRQSTGSDIVKELDYEILVFQKAAANRAERLEMTYESMRGQTTSVRKMQRYINARGPSTNRDTAKRSNETDPMYADMDKQGANAVRQDVRRVRSMEDLLGSNHGNGSSKQENLFMDEEATHNVDHPTPPPSHGHVFDTPGYIQMKSNTNRSASVCLLSSSVNSN
ncbi:uncharacterized protein [Apostichopus japonicus]|uniref:uncharacterized protein isoform X4 n=1 Tax=Stichopus japonicus TaxID=307972 RepID=UPI003AB61306